MYLPCHLGRKHPFTHSPENFFGVKLWIYQLFFFWEFAWFLQAILGEFAWKMASYGIYQNMEYNHPIRMSPSKLWLRVYHPWVIEGRRWSVAGSWHHGFWRLPMVGNCNQPIWGFPKMGVPRNRWFIRENPMKLYDDWGYPHFRKPTHMDEDMVGSCGIFRESSSSGGLYGHADLALKSHVMAVKSWTWGLPTSWWVCHELREDFDTWQPLGC